MLEWVCEQCGEPIADGAGYVCVDERAARAFEEKEVAWQAQTIANQTAAGSATGFISGADLLDYPQPVHWEFLHEACDPHPNRANDYWYAIERVRTPGDVLSRSAHLLESKDWLRHTDWHLVLSRAAAQLGD